MEAIHADLSGGSGIDLTQAKSIKENMAVACEGMQKNGSFEIQGNTARQMLLSPNPHGISNSLVVKPWANGNDLTSRPSDMWIISFSPNVTEEEAACFEQPFSYLLQHVKPGRLLKPEPNLRERWWIFKRPIPKLRANLQKISRYIATPRVAKHRFFTWVSSCVVPDSRLNVCAREDDAIFGILHSRIHEVWALANASMHGVGNDPTYNAKSCFETFPFPEGLTPNLAPADYTNSAAAEIAAAAQKLNELRDNWLNPPEWADWVRTPEEEKAGYPARPVAKHGHEADLKKRTLTNLYNVRPAWLDNAHKTLDAVVAKAYGWNDYTQKMPDEGILRRLLKLNLARSR